MNSSQIVQLLVGLLGGIVTAVITVRLTVRYAMRRFYSEKTWERKSQSYMAIIESSHHVRNHADTNLTFELDKRELSEDGASELRQKLQHAMAELRKQRDIGTFVISTEATGAIDDLMRGLESSTQATNWQDHLEMKLVAVERCLIRMRSIAKSDLDIR